MKQRHLLVSLFVLFSSFAHCQYLVEVEYISSSPAFLLGFVPQIPNDYDIDFYKITYNTVDVHGNPTVASGAMSIPSTDECNFFPLGVYCHGTVLRQSDVPSANNFEALITKVFASSGFITIAPDYIGLGENEGIHPYVHDLSQATATVDLIRAAREYLETTEVSDNGETFITGYSQGGHAAMGTLKYIQENDLNEEIGVVAGAPCSGPYNMSGSQADVILSDEPYSNTGYIIYLLMSYELAYGNLYNEFGDIVQSPYDEDVLPYFDGAQDEYDMDAVNAILPTSISELLVDSVLTNFENNLGHPLRVALEDNNNYDWVPEIPLRMFYCDGDEQVFFENSLFAEEWMNDNGATDVEAINSMAGADHGGCVIPALSDTYAFFAGLATSCESTNSLFESHLAELEIYPNPAQNDLTIIVPEERGKMIIQDLLGRIVIEMDIDKMQSQADISGLNRGTYVITVKTDDLLRKQTLIVQ